MNTPSLDPLATEILMEAARDATGYITVARSPWPCFEVATNGETWRAEDDPELEADLEAAIRQLERDGLVELASYTREVFKMTQKGYKTADDLK